MFVKVLEPLMVSTFQDKQAHTANYDMCRPLWGSWICMTQSPLRQLPKFYALKMLIKGNFYALVSVGGILHPSKLEGNFYTLVNCRGNLFVLCLNGIFSVGADFKFAPAELWRWPLENCEGGFSLLLLLLRRWSFCLTFSFPFHLCPCYSLFIFFLG